MTDPETTPILTQAEAAARREGEARVSVASDGTIDGHVQATWRGKAWELWLRATGQYQVKPGPNAKVIKGEFGAKW